MYKIQKRRWFSLSVSIFHHVFHCSLSTAWKPSVMLLPFHRRNTQAAPSISPPKTARILHSKHRRNEVLTLLSQTTRIELQSLPLFLTYWGLEYLVENLSFLWYALLSFWHMTSKSFCFANKMKCKSISGSAVIYKPAQYCINEIFELTVFGRFQNGCNNDFR